MSPSINDKNKFKRDSNTSQTRIQGIILWEILL